MAKIWIKLHVRMRVYFQVENVDVHIQRNILSTYIQTNNLPNYISSSETSISESISTSDRFWTFSWRVVAFGP